MTNGNVADLYNYVAEVQVESGYEVGPGPVIHGTTQVVAVAL